MKPESSARAECEDDTECDMAILLHVKVEYSGGMVLFTDTPPPCFVLYIFPLECDLGIRTSEIVLPSQNCI